MANVYEDYKDIIHAVALFLIVLLEAFLVGLALFYGGGAEEQSNIIKVLFSQGWGIVGIIVILLMKVMEYLCKKNKQLDKKIGWMGSIIHDPETSFFPTKTKYFSWMKNVLMVILVSWVIFSIVGLFQVYQNTFLTTLPPRVSQQITETSQAILAVIPADQEIFIPVAIGGLLIALFSWLNRVKKMPKEVSLSLTYIAVPLLTAVSWLALHTLRYGNDALSLRYVFIFGLMIGATLVIFRSIIYAWILKVTGNLYQYLNGMITSDETILIWTLIINFILIVILILFINLRKKGANSEA